MILQTPKTCENFIRLCKKQYYDGTIFHRSIRNFVVSDGRWGSVVWDLQADSS